MILRRRYCSDRMCGATDCSTCYGPGYDREDDDELEEDDGPERRLDFASIREWCQLVNAKVSDASRGAFVEEPFAPKGRERGVMGPARGAPPVDLDMDSIPF